MSGKIKPVTIGEVKEIAHLLAQKHLEWGEPVPDFDTRNPNILESCLAVPFQSFSGKYAYKEFSEKGAMLFYLMIKNHPFQNGNKRIALTTLLVFLLKNGKHLVADNTEIYNIAKWVVESNPKLKKETVAAIKKFIETYVKKSDYKL